MPHLNVYVDDKTLKKVRSAARKEGTSVSKWVRKRIEPDLTADEWPEGYFDLFGCLADVEDFDLPERPRTEDDAPREDL